jgi:hypothetical protein
MMFTCPVRGAWRGHCAGSWSSSSAASPTGMLGDPDPFSFAVSCCALRRAADQDSLIPDPDSSFCFW